MSMYCKVSSLSTWLGQLLHELLQSGMAWSSESPGHNTSETNPICGASHPLETVLFPIMVPISCVLHFADIMQHLPIRWKEGVNMKTAVEQYCYPPAFLADSIILSNKIMMPFWSMTLTETM